MININVDRWTYLSPYAICFALSLTLGMVVLTMQLKKFMAWNMIQLQLMMSILFPLIGGKAYGYLLSDNPDRNLINAPMGSIGGLLGLLVSAISFGIIYGKDKKQIMDSHIIVLPLMYGMAKIGCFFAGCCAGKPYSGWMSVHYSGVKYSIPSGERIPVQLIEAIAFISIFVIGMVIFKKNEDYATQVIIVVCAFAKGGIELLREESIDVFISPNQIICIILSIIAVTGMIVQYINDKKKCMVHE